MSRWPGCLYGDRRRTAGRRRGDRGQAGGMEVLPFGLLMFVSTVLVIANAWGVIDAKLAVTSAAREAARAYAEASDPAAAAAAAHRRASETLSAFGRGGVRASVGDPVLARGFRRCGRVSVTVSYEVPAVAVPFIGGFGDSLRASSTFSEVIDPFRSGLSGESQC